MQSKNNRNPVIDTRVAVVINTRDARKDRMVPRKVAKQMLVDGKLYWDLNNRQYGSDVDLPQYQMRG